MADYIDTKYINLLSPQLLNFKRKNDTLYNFSCPYCGDSSSNKNKARGYIFEIKGSYAYKCHNCGQGASIGNLIKFVNPNMHKEYSLEKFSVKNTRPVKNKAKTDTQFKFKKKPDYMKTELKNLKKISQLPVDHPARVYVVNRGIPSNKHYKLFYAPKFYKFAKAFAPDKFGDIKKDEPRLIIPFIDRNEKLVAIQGRAFGKSNLRYITLKVDPDAPKIYGLDSINRSERVYIVEGPIDSMFLDNAVAMGGADLSKQTIDRIGTDDLVFVFDNEPRNREIIKRIENIIDLGYNISLFPDYIKEKDINDMILSGMDKEEVQAIISANTFSGLAAKSKLSEWKRI